MLAVSATGFSTEDPLTGLSVGDVAEVAAPEGWTTVNVRAASLNHHDLWTLRGVGITEKQLPDDPRLRRRRDRRRRQRGQSCTPSSATRTESAAGETHAALRDECHDALLKLIRNGRPFKRRR